MFNERGRVPLGESPENDNEQEIKQEVKPYKPRTAFEHKMHKLKTLIVGSGIVLAEFYSANKISEYIDSSHDKQAENEWLSEVMSGGPKVKLDAEFLKSRYGKERVPLLLLLAQAEANKEAKGDGPSTPVLVGFENTYMTPGLAPQLWNESMYPKGSINGVINKIEYKDISSPMPADYNIKRQNEKDNLADAQANLANDTVTFFRDSKSQHAFHAEETDNLAFDAIFAHEWGHMNDWYHQPKLTPAERVQFWAEVTRAFETKGAYRDPSHYVERINNPNPQLQEQYRVAEWWGTLTMAYFSDPSGFSHDHPKNFTLVDKWVHKIDPKFNVKKMAPQRTELALTASWHGQAQEVINIEVVGKRDSKDQVNEPPTEAEHLKKYWNPSEEIKD